MEDKKLDKILEKVSNLEIQQDKTLNIVVDTQKKVSILETQQNETLKKVSSLEVQQNETLKKVSSLEVQQDKTLSIVLDTQSAVKDLSERLMHLEEQHEKTFNKLDGFLTLIERHEVEIAAIRSHIERLEDRIDLLEKKLAVA